MSSHVTRIDHVGFAVPDLDEAKAFYAAAFGLEVVHEEVNEEQGVREAMLGVGGSYIQLLAPLTPESTIAKFLDRSGPGIQQIAFGVDDVVATADALRADLTAAFTLARRRGVTLKSIVFPRNQYSDESLEVCKAIGLTHFRGNAKGWAYRALPGVGQTRPRRALRLLDAYSRGLGSQVFDPAVRQGLIDVPASRFLRPCAGRLAPLHPLHIATIKRGMTVAAKQGKGYHLWWHPHNFGREIEANLQGLSQIIAHFRALRDRFGMASCAMEDIR
jgi:methylmalonyl-CoA epimerase